IDAFLKTYRGLPENRLEAYREEEKKHFDALVKLLTEEPDAYKWPLALTWANACVKLLKDKNETEKADRLQRMIDRRSSKSPAPPREGRSYAARDTALG